MITVRLKHHVNVNRCNKSHNVTIQVQAGVTFWEATNVVARTPCENSAQRHWQCVHKTKETENEVPLNEQTHLFHSQNESSWASRPQNHQVPKEAMDILTGAKSHLRHFSPALLFFCGTYCRNITVPYKLEFCFDLKMLAICKCMDLSEKIDCHT